MFMYVYVYMYMYLYMILCDFVRSRDHKREETLIYLSEAGLIQLIQQSPASIHLSANDITSLFTAERKLNCMLTPYFLYPFL